RNSRQPFGLRHLSLEPNIMSSSQNPAAPTICLFVHGKSLVHVAPLATTDLEKAIVRPGSPLKQSYVRLRVSHRNPRHPNTLAESRPQGEILRQKAVGAPGRGAPQSPCPPHRGPPGRGPRAGACAQACLVYMSASTVPPPLL